MTYFTAKSGVRHYTKLYKVTYDRARVDNVYQSLRLGILPTFDEVVHARDVARRLLGLGKTPDFLTGDGQHKMALSNAMGGNIKSWVMHLAPAKNSGYNTCPEASDGCAKSCLYKSGHGILSSNQAARIKRTRLYFEHRSVFAVVLFDRLERLSKSKDYQSAIRLNGTSDILWEKREPWIFEVFAGLIFYDYTKVHQRFAWKIPSNYHLTFSRSESNHDLAMHLLSLGHNVAIVFEPDLFKRVTLSGEYSGYRAIDATLHDRRFEDPRGVVCALKPLGPAKQDDSGFVLRSSLQMVGGIV